MFCGPKRNVRDYGNVYSAGSVVSRLPDAADLLEKFVMEEEMSDFLTLDAYDKLVSEGY